MSQCLFIKTIILVGLLLNLRIPQGEFVVGPEQADAYIDADSQVNQQITLWIRHGSEVVRQLDEFYSNPAADPVRQVQFRQKDRTRWEALVEVAPGLLAENSAQRPLPAVADRLASIVRQTFGRECQVETRFVDAIPRVRGKLRYYRGSELSGT